MNVPFYRESQVHPSFCQTPPINQTSQHATGSQCSLECPAFSRARSLLSSLCLSLPFPSLYLSFSPLSLPPSFSLFLLLCPSFSHPLFLSPSPSLRPPSPSFSRPYLSSSPLSTLSSPSPLSCSPPPPSRLPLSPFAPHLPSSPLPPFLSPHVSVLRCQRLQSWLGAG